MKTENKNQIPQNPERGMRIKAIYIGKMVGNCIVDRVDASKDLLIRRDVECLEGNTVQYKGGGYYES